MHFKVSLIIPCYNGERCLNDTLTSICNQDFDNVEVVVVDDASTDATPQILETWKSKFRDRGYEMRTARHAENKGLCAAINTGLELCTGEYLSFPDSDDYLYSEYVSSFVAALESNPEYGWAMCKAEVFNEDFAHVRSLNPPAASVYKNVFYDFLSMRVPHNAFLMMVRKAYFERCTGGKIYDSRLTQEWPLYFPLSFHGEYLRVPKTLYRYFLRKDAMSRWLDGELESVEQHELDLMSLRRAVLSSLPLGEEDRTTAHSVLELVCAHRIYTARLKRGRSTAVIEEKLSSIMDAAFVSFNSMTSPRLGVEHALDALLSVNPSPLLEELQRQRELFSRGYIVYGAGCVCRGLIGGLIAVLGLPAAIWDQDCRDVIHGISVTAPNFSVEKLPVVISVTRRSYVSEIKTMLETNGWDAFVEAAQIVNALRGYAIEQRARGSFTK